MQSVDATQEPTVKQPDLSEVMSDDNYQTAVEVLRHMNSESDTYNWQMGDYVCEIINAIMESRGSIYGLKVVETLAIDSGVGESTLKNCRRVSERIPPDAREDFLTEFPLPWSILNVAVRVGKTTDEIKDFLTFCSDQQDVTSPKDYRRMMARYRGLPEKPKKPKKPEKLGDAVVVAFSDGAACCLEIEDHLTPEWWQAGKTYRIEIWECE